MARCEFCGNNYDKTIQITRNGEVHTFDCFECAIQVMAPTCENCGVRIIGHGMEANGRMFCCDHCAEAQGVTSLKDRASSR